MSKTFEKLLKAQDEKIAAKLQGLDKVWEIKQKELQKKIEEQAQKINLQETKIDGLQSENANLKAKIAESPADLVTREELRKELDRTVLMGPAPTFDSGFVESQLVPPTLMQVAEGNTCSPVRIRGIQGDRPRKDGQNMIVRHWN